MKKSIILFAILSLCVLGMNAETFLVTNAWGGKGVSKKKVKELNQQMFGTIVEITQDADGKIVVESPGGTFIFSHNKGSHYDCTDYRLLWDDQHKYYMRMVMTKSFEDCKSLLIYVERNTHFIYGCKLVRQ